MADAETPSSSEFDHIGPKREAVAEAVHAMWRGPCPWYAEDPTLREWFLKIADAAMAAMKQADHDAAARDLKRRTGISTPPAGGEDRG